MGRGIRDRPSTQDSTTAVSQQVQQAMRSRVSSFPSGQTHMRGDRWLDLRGDGASADE